MKSLLLFLLLTLPAHAQHIGFKGLNIAQTQAEVNKLIATSQWEYGYRRGLEPDAADTDRHDPNGIGIALYNKTTFGCVEVGGENRCFQPDQVRVRYHQDRVFDIDVWGPWSTDNNRSELTHYANAMIATLSATYGAPTMSYESPESLSQSAIIDSLDSRNESFIDIAEWQWTQQSKARPQGNRKPKTKVVSTIRVRLYRAIDPSTRRPHSTIMVDLTDELATEDVASMVE